MKILLSSKIVILIVIVLQIQCRTQHPESLYPNFVCDINFDKKIDGNHVVCDEKKVFQYHNFSKGPVYPKSKKLFQDDCKKFKFDQKVDGMVRVRFVVNCKGEAGRFRTISGRMDGQTFTIDETVGTRLIDFIKSQGNWPIMTDNEIVRDYYAYLIFVFEKGQIKTIRP